MKYICQVSVEKNAGDVYECFMGANKNVLGIERMGVAQNFGGVILCLSG